MTEIIYGSNDFKEPKLVHNGVEVFLELQLNFRHLSVWGGVQSFGNQISNHKTYDFYLPLIFLKNL